MVCKVNSIFDEIFKIYMQIKSGFTDFVKEILKKNERLKQFKEKGDFSNSGKE